MRTRSCGYGCCGRSGTPRRWTRSSTPRRTDPCRPPGSRCRSLRRCTSRRSRSHRRRSTHPRPEGHRACAGSAPAGTPRLAWARGRRRSGRSQTPGRPAGPRAPVAPRGSAARRSRGLTTGSSKARRGRGSSENHRRWLHRRAPGSWPRRRRVCRHPRPATRSAPDLRSGPVSAESTHPEPQM